MAAGGILSMGKKPMSSNMRRAVLLPLPDIPVMITQHFISLIVSFSAMPI
jgi:hypothetical protein